MRGHTLQKEVRAGEAEEAVRFYIRNQDASRHRHKAFTEKDVSLLLLHGVLGLGAMVSSPERWPALCQFTSAPRAMKYRRRDFAGFADRVADVLGETDPARVTALFRAVHRRLHERHMTYVRERHSPKTMTTEVVGLRHLQKSLEKGKGAILWGTPSLSDAIVAKRSLFEAGVPAYQLSVNSHGFSETRFAERFLNPRQIAVENQYLGGRIRFEGEDVVRVTREIMRKLKQNHPIIFANTLHSGRAFTKVPASSRYSLLFPTTPLSIAVKSGVPLHIMTTVETVPFRHYVTGISEPLTADAVAGEGDDARIASMALRARDIIVRDLRNHPDQFRLWDRLVERN